MTSLRDIVKMKEEVQVGEHTFAITGITAQSLGILLEQFPALRDLMTDRAARKAAMAEINPNDVIKKIPEAIGHIIAAGIGKAGDQEEAAAAADLSVGVQVEFLTKIIKVTFPRGFANFQAALEELINGGVPVVSGKEADTKSPEQSSKS